MRDERLDLNMRELERIYKNVSSFDSGKHIMS